MLIFLGLLAIVVLTAATGYFVAQEFTYMAVDRGRLQSLAEQGDKPADRAYRVTQRLSFMLSGAQLGITVTALLVGFVAEPLLGAGLADLLGFTGWPEAAMAGALDVQLAGPRIYGGALVSEPMINGAGRAVATVADVETGVSIFYRACGSLTVLAAITALFFSIV